MDQIYISPIAAIFQQIINCRAAIQPLGINLSHFHYHTECIRACILHSHTLSLLLRSPTSVTKPAAIVEPEDRSMNRPRSLQVAYSSRQIGRSTSISTTALVFLTRHLTHNLSTLSSQLAESINQHNTATGI